MSFGQLWYYNTEEIIAIVPYCNLSTLINVFFFFFLNRIKIYREKFDLQTL